MLTAYECVGCFAILPYRGIHHNCPRGEDDEGFEEDQGYLPAFLLRLNVTEHRVVEAPAPSQEQVQQAAQELPQMLEEFPELAPAVPHVMEELNQARTAQQ